MAGSGRVEVVREGGRLAAVMRGGRRPGVAAFLAAWLAGWAVGEWEVVRRLFLAEEPSAGLAFLLVWLALWTAGGLAALLAFLRSLGGSEVVAVEGGRVSLRRRPLGRRRAFAIPEVRALRAEPWPRSGATLAFDARGRTVRFGAGLEPAEVERVLQALSTRLPRGPSSLHPEPPEAGPEDHGG